MSSRRRVRARECTGKVKHETEAAARRALAVSARRPKFEGTVGVYRCRFCRGWHLGHTPGRNAP